MHDDEGGKGALSATRRDGAAPPAKVCNRMALVALLVGIGLLWVLPLAGVLLSVTATFVLVISWEMHEALMTPMPTLIAAVAPDPVRADANPCRPVDARPPWA